MGYGGIKTIYGGQEYDSKAESRYAQGLDLRKKAGEIKEIKSQFKLPLYVQGKLICNYIADFMVILPDGSMQIHEVKGFKTGVFKIKWKLAQALYEDKYKFILIKV